MADHSLSKEKEQEVEQSAEDSSDKKFFDRKIIFFVVLGVILLGLCLYWLVFSKDFIGGDHKGFSLKANAKYATTDITQNHSMHSVHDKTVDAGLVTPDMSFLLLIQYQVKLALLKAKYENNPQQALSLLEQAKEQAELLANIDNQLLVKQLTEAIELYKSQPVLDSFAILHKLDFIKKELDFLVIDKKEVIPLPEKAKSNNKADWWTAVWFEIKNNLGKLIKVSKLPTPMDQAVVFKQWDLFIEIEQLKLAVLTGDDQVFQRQLLELKNKIKHCCKEKITQQEQVLTAIRSLQRINIKPIEPNADDVLQSLAQLITAQGNLKIKKDSNK